MYGGSDYCVPDFRGALFGDGMSLIEPNFWDKYKLWIIGGGLAAILALGVILWSFDAFGSWRFNRKQDALKTNVNAGLANIKEREKVIANLKEQQAVETKMVELQTKELLEAVNATDKAREETDKVLEKLSNVNGNTNVSVEELERKLQGL